MTGGLESATVTVFLTNKLGLHARPVMKFIREAVQHRGCTIRVTYRDTKCNGKNAIELVTLDAPCGDRLTIEANGDGASEAVAALGNLVEKRFDETAVVIEFLVPACVKVPLLGNTREEVIQELMDLIDRQHNVSCADRLVSSAIERETSEIPGTSQGYGIAAPHALDPDCPGLFTAIGRLRTPIDWRAVDGRPVRIVVLTVGLDSSYQRALIDMSSVLSSQPVQNPPRSA